MFFSTGQNIFPQFCFSLFVLVKNKMSVGLAVLVGYEHFARPRPSHCSDYTTTIQCERYVFARRQDCANVALNSY